MDELTLTLQYPLTDEEWDAIVDVDFEYTNEITFYTKNGKKVDFVKKPHWIPCSERLPEDKDYDETFSVTIQCEHVNGWDDYVTGYADWTPHGWDIQSYYLGQIKVTAWMPLPEPYQPEEES